MGSGMVKNLKNKKRGGTDAEDQHFGFDTM